MKSSDCSLKTSKPVYPYWKLQNSRLEGLLAIEVPAFGIADPTPRSTVRLIMVGGQLVVAQQFISTPPLRLSVSLLVEIGKIYQLCGFFLR
jgi:hypothetical protein